MRIAPIERPETLKESAYHGIKQLLTSGQLQTQTVYSANQFAEMLEVSRTPVREALLQLGAEGFLTVVGGKGFKLKEFSEKEIKDFFETRRIIEYYVIGQVANALTPEDIQKLEEYLEEMKKYAASKVSHRFLEADRNFHLYLIHRNQNHHLEAIMDNVRNLISIVGQYAVSFKRRYEEVISEHEDVLNALKRKDRDAAVQAIAFHLSTTETYLLAHLKAQREEQVPA